MKPRGTKLVAIVLAFAVSGFFSGAGARAQSSAAAISGDTPETALASALAAACRQSDAAFGGFLTADSAAAFQALPATERTELMQRFVLLEEPGKALLSSEAGQQVVRCESAGFTTEMHFGATRQRDNLAFIPIEIPVPGGDPPRSITFGLVRENGNWKLLSLGLVLLDIPALAKEWSQSDLQTHEQTAVNDLRQLATALKTYRAAYGKLPDGLAPLGPAQKGDISPDNAGLIDADLAAGNKDGYAFRYSIVPASGNLSAEDADKSAGFALAASPAPYGPGGKRSFFLDSEGVLRGADKQGAVATSEDPRVDTP